MDERDDEIKALTLLKSAVDNANDAFVTIDERHRVLFFNKAAEKIFGHARDEVVGHDLDVIMSPSCSRDHREAVRRYVETRVPRRIGHDTEIVAVRKSGETFPASISFSVSEVSGTLYFTALVRDLTETKALQDQLVRAERLAALGQFVAEITHEIKNPLMMIGGFAGQLLREAKSTRAQKKLEIITKEVRRLEGLLSELKAFYLPSKPKLEPLDMGGLLSEVLALFKDECREAGIRAQLKVDPEPLWAQGDRAKLHQLFLNLVKNAIESMDGGGRLLLETERRGDHVLIRIMDTGGGIAEDLRGQVFSPFVTTKTQGSGLGLSICKRIVEDHPGYTLDFASGVGQGTTFTLTVPISAPDQS
jgi:PAS domain S-box-containing protein